MASASIPPAQRRLAILVTVGTAIALVVGSLLVNLVAGSPINWFWLVAGSLFITLLIVFFLWVRLSD